MGLFMILQRGVKLLTRASRSLFAYMFSIWFDAAYLVTTAGFVVDLLV